MVNYVNYPTVNWPSVNWGNTHFIQSHVYHDIAMHDLALANSQMGCGIFGYGFSAPVCGFGMPVCGFGISPFYNPMIGFCNSFMLGNVIGQSVGLGIRLISQIFHKKKSS